MDRSLARLLAVALAPAAIGCASTGTGGQSPYQQSHVTIDGPMGRYDLLLTREQYLSSDTLTVSPRRAWSALVQTYSSLGVPLQGADASSYMIATQYVRAHSSFAGEHLSRWLDCGSTITGDIANSYEVTLRFGTLLDTSVAGRTIVRTALSASAIASGSGTTPVECTSRGSFEKRIAALVASGSG